jgi:4a-hydroxytetrahydrobiopterin dehydratase
MSEAPPDRLSQAEVIAKLGELAAWTLRDDGRAICRTYNFATFVDAFGFMAMAALCAERADHHPEWFNVYGRVEVTLTTHDVAGLSERDFRLARELEACASRRL